MDNNKVGKFIASRRKELGLTQQALANKIYVTDKAISKWERGLSLPDITLLEKLSKILKVEIEDILSGEKNTTKKIDVEKDLEIIKKELLLTHQKKKNKLIICLIFLIVTIIYTTFRNVTLGYKLDTVNYSHSNKTINIGIPKTSFMMRHNDKSYSYKNLRNSSIIENETKKYLKTLTYSLCNDTIYYYDKQDDFSIIEYSVKNNLLYSTISYQIDNGDYCYNQKMDEYANKLGGLGKLHTLNGGYIDKNSKKTPKIEILFLDGSRDVNNNYEFTASIQIIAINRNNKNEFNNYILEDSTGEYEIKDNKLYYYRKEIKEKHKDINIPEVSTFIIDNGNLILTDNYIKKYYNKEIILK